MPLGPRAGGIFSKRYAPTLSIERHRCKARIGRDFCRSKDAPPAAKPATPLLNFALDFGRKESVGAPACAQCHAFNGGSDGSGAFPRIAGQSAYYLGKQLRDFTSGVRANAIMSPIAKGKRFAGNNLACQTRPACSRHRLSRPPERRGHEGASGGNLCASLRGMPGSDGLGQRAQNGIGYQFPPLWGPDSYNIGAGMSRLLTAAAYALHNMPLGTKFDAPVLTDEQAYDVAGYIVSQNPRLHTRFSRRHVGERHPEVLKALVVP